MADVLSIIATAVPNATRKALQYRLVGSKDNLTSWGQEYLRNISGEIAETYIERQNQLLENLTKMTDTQQPKPQLEVSVSLGRYALPLDA